MRKLLLGLIGLLFAMPAVADTSGAISSVTVAGLVAQNGTPTPTTPIDIVSNNGVLKVRTNLINPNAITDNYYYSPNGEYVAASNARLTDWISVKAGQEYTVYAKSLTETNKNIRINFFDDSKVWQSQEILTVSGTNGDSVLVVTPMVNGYIRISASQTTDWTVMKVVNGEYTTSNIASAINTIYTDGEVETIGDSANHTATVATLLGVGDYRDTQNINTGAITRNIGVKVLDGTENWKEDDNSFYLDGDYNGVTAADANLQSSSHYKYNGSQSADSLRTKNQAFYLWGGGNRLRIRDTTVGSLTDFTDFLAAQYANGTPVIVIYPLATPTTESVAGQTMTTAPVNNRTGGVAGMTITTLLSSGASVVTTIAANAIKIATTAYNSARFSPVMTELNDTIATIRSVVTNTINQTKAIADLQANKQTRPDENCPAGKKCLLVEDNDGTPHWYEIIESANRLPDGFTELQYIESTGTQYIDTGVMLDSTDKIEVVAMATDAEQDKSTYFFGAYDSANGFGLNFYNPSMAYYPVWKNVAAVATSTLFVLNTLYTFEMSSAGVYANGTQIATVSGTFTGTKNAYLFWANATLAKSLIGRIYSAKIWKAGTLTRDLVPAKNASGVIGMYDTVSGRFFTNAGTGTFAAGPVVQ